MLFKIKNLQRYLRSQIEVKTLKIFFKTNLKRKILKISFKSTYFSDNGDAVLLMWGSCRNHIEKDEKFSLNALAKI